GIPRDPDWQPRQRAGELVLRLADLLDVFGTTGGDLHRLVARLDHRLESGFFEIHRAPDRVDEVGDEVVAAFELDVDLLKGVQRLVLGRDEAVVGPDHPPDHDDDEYQQDPRAHRCSRVKGGAGRSATGARHYAGRFGRSFESACRTASATPASSAPSRASG